MIEVFELHRDDLPRDIYFVPSPANGTMAYDVYYQHLRLHHAHISNLRSFAISNVRDIKTEITVYGSDGVSDPRTMPFETALLSQLRTGTTESLFYSIEPTQASTSEGRYLLVTHKDSIKEAELFIDNALTALNKHTENRVRVQLDDAPIARTNRINTSNRFQDYANKLKNMIPSTIEMPATPQNAWKRRNPTLINLTDDTFPPLTSKKQKSSANDNMTTPTTDTSEASTDLDLSSFMDELAKIRQENEDMQQRLQTHFQTAIRDLEIRMEQRTQSMVSTMGQTITQAVEHMNQQTARSDERLASFLSSFQAQADRMTAQMDRMMSRPSETPNTSPNSTPLRRNRRRTDSPLALPRHNVPETWEMDDDEIYDNDIDDDKSRTSSASRASHPQYGMDATTGGRK
jgi:hypothetical protein